MTGSLTTIAQAQNTNKCPHGLPQGTCPICNGTMGASKRTDRDKPRVPGEMSYNECMAEWLRMQRAKDLKAHDRLESQKLHQEELRENTIKHRILFHLEKIQTKFDKVIEKIESIAKKAPATVQVALRVVVLPIVRIALAVINFAQNTISAIFAASEKISSLLGEIKNFIKNFIDDKKEKIKNAKKAFKVVLSLFMNFGEENEEDDNDNRKEIEKWTH